MREADEIVLISPFLAHRGRTLPPVIPFKTLIAASNASSSFVCGLSPVSNAGLLRQTQHDFPRVGVLTAKPQQERARAGTPKTLEHRSSSNWTFTDRIIAAAQNQLEGRPMLQDGVAGGSFLEDQAPGS